MVASLVSWRVLVVPFDVTRFLLTSIVNLSAPCQGRGFVYFFVQWLNWTCLLNPIFWQQQLNLFLIWVHGFAVSNLTFLWPWNIWQSTGFCWFRILLQQEDFKSIWVPKMSRFHVAYSRSDIMLGKKGVVEFNLRERINSISLEIFPKNQWITRFRCF